MKTALLDLKDPDVEVHVELVEPRRPTRGQRTVGADAGDRVSSEVLSRAIRAVGGRLRQELAALADPDELTLEFGASLQGGAAVLLSAQGTFKVTLKWTKPAPKEAPPSPAR